MTIAATLLRLRSPSRFPRHRNARGATVPGWLALQAPFTACPELTCATAFARTCPVFP
ncbi:hypothetical protein BAY1663_03975 [Pseudomonas sp. BAY1663]|nr:hypothetical protein BAY1663_03975 [Pseudomonas sp. BAY1663]